MRRCGFRVSSSPSRLRAIRVRIRLGAEIEIKVVLEVSVISEMILPTERDKDPVGVVRLARG
jgi:hypothetical protein